MKAKVPKKIQQKQIRQQRTEQQIEQQSQQNIHINDINLKPRLIKRDALFVTFSGVIETGHFDIIKPLTLVYSIAAGPDWKILIGNRTGQTQVGSSDGQNIVWNFPFQISYQTTVLGGWPQLLIILYGHDFFGKPFVEGYGNVHLPTSGGIQMRKMRVFNPKPRSVISGILGYFQGLISQYRDYEKVLAHGQGRQVTRTQSLGHISVKIEVSKFNFKKFGYQ